jgi:hypothetical protein
VSLINTLSKGLQGYAQAVIEAGLVPQEALEAWLTDLSARGEALYDLAEQLPAAGLVSEFVLARDLAKHLNLPFMGELELELYAGAHPALSRNICSDYGVLCVSDGPREPLPVAVTNPFDEEVLAYVSQLVGAELALHITTPSALIAELDACYGPEDEAEVLNNSLSEPLSEPLSETSQAHSSADTKIEPAELQLLVSDAEALEQHSLIEAFKRRLASEG